jgi:tetratricopeptide (TPR) repeat protein
VANLLTIAQPTPAAAEKAAEQTTCPTFRTSEFYTGKPPDKRQAADYYREALEYYRKAYHAAQDYYPGINVASLLWMVCDSGDARQMARAVIRDMDAHEGSGIPWKRDEEVWVLATKGEANLLLGKIDRAKEWYRRACEHPGCTPHAKETMKNTGQPNPPEAAEEGPQAGGSRRPVRRADAGPSGGHFAL